MQKSISNGHIIDEYCSIKDGEIVKYKDDIYSCTLNQTDLKSNKNKFYIMQLIKNGSSYINFMRWGRIGDSGRTSEKKYSSLESSINAYEKQFRSKTGNQWKDRFLFVKKDKKYFLSEIGYEEEFAKIEAEKKDVLEITSELDVRIQNVIKLISDLNMMKNALVELDIDTKKMPLGKLRQSQIEKAEKLLDQIEKFINDKVNDFEELSSKYYTLIPIACGRKKPPLISTQEKLQEYRSVLNDLKNMIVATKIIKKKSLYMNPIDGVYKEMNAVMQPVNKRTKEWKILLNYFKNTHAPTHNFKLDLVDILKLKRKEIDKEFNDIADKIGNCQLLIHGSRLSNWMSIIKLGLLLDPSKLGVHIAGKMFGYGIYFANSFSKSAQYCGINYGRKTRIVLVLAEVALGNELERLSSDYYVSNSSLQKTNHHSCWGVGQMTPSKYDEIDGMKIPTGKLVKSGKNSVLRYDEKVIYNDKQYRFKYLVIADVSY